MHLAWFSPIPPVKSGIAGRSAELVEALQGRGYDIDIFVDGPPSLASSDASARASARYSVFSAHDFLWRHRRQPYDLTVYQFGNSSHHDYAWAYALQHPGLVVLHDTHLHHARAAFLLRERRVDHYRAEFRWNHPDVNPDVAELAVAGFDSALYYDHAMVRTLVATSRLVAVHGDGARAELLDGLRDAAIDRLPERIVSIRLGEGESLTLERERAARHVVRARYGIADDAVVFGCFGGLTPEKRIPQVLAALRAIQPHAPSARLLLAGAPATQYDVAAAIAAHGLEDRVTLTGYLERDADLTDHIAACDVSLNLRWPTARETSGPWLRALAAGRPTVITDLVHNGDVPSLDPRTWTAREVGGWRSEDGGWRSEVGKKTTPERASVVSPELSTPSLQPPIPNLQPPVCIAIDILDEDHSLRLAMRRLATDPALRERLGRAGLDWWEREHTVEAMVEDYERVMRDAASRPDPAVDLPAHLRNAGDRKLRALLAPFGIEAGL